mgnify:CR=1 FL=1
MASRAGGSKGIARTAIALVYKLLDQFRNNPDAIKQVIQDFPNKMKDSSGRVSFTLQATAMYYALRDSKTPIKVKAWLAAALAYFIMPIDVIPDWIFGLGFTDDLAVIVFVLRQLSGAITPEHYELARRRLQR